MPLSEVEKKVLNRVVQRFLNDRKAAFRRDLVLDFEEPEAIDRLQQWMLIQTNDSTYYLPTSIAFHYCGDTEVQALARRSTEIVQGTPEKVRMAAGIALLVPPTPYG